MPAYTRETPHGKELEEMTTRSRNRREGRKNARWEVLMVFGYTGSGHGLSERLASGKPTLAPAFPAMGWG
jgi:50S ribosomal subunit-associated GTPase HflX